MKQRGHYLTGTLTSLMAELVAWTWSPAGWLSRAETARDASVSVSWPQRIGLLTGVFFVYALGALAGGALHARSSALVAWLPLAAVVVVVANGEIRHGHAERGREGASVGSDPPGSFQNETLTPIGRVVDVAGSSRPTLSSSLRPDRRSRLYCRRR